MRSTRRQAPGCLSHGLHAVQHPIDNNAGEGDVEPDGESVAGDFAVCGEAALEGAGEGEDGEDGDGGGEDGVGEEDGEIDGANGSGTGEADRADFEVVDEVGDEEDDADAEGGEHGVFVGFALAVADEDVAGDEQHGGEGVKRGVDGGEGAVVHGGELGGGRLAELLAGGD